MALGVETAGDAIGEDPLDLLGPSSAELREEQGKPTEVEIFSTFGRREQEALGSEELDACPAS